MDSYSFIFKNNSTNLVYFQASESRPTSQIYAVIQNKSNQSFASRIKKGERLHL